jgi:hypothetical protein
METFDTTMGWMWCARLSARRREREKRSKCAGKEQSTIGVKLMIETFVFAV